MLRILRMMASVLLPGIPLLPISAYALSWNPDVAGRLGHFLAACARFVGHAIANMAHATLHSLPAALVPLLAVLLCCAFAGAALIRARGAGR